MWVLDDDCLFFMVSKLSKLSHVLWLVYCWCWCECGCGCVDDDAYVDVDVDAYVDADVDAILLVYLYQSQT